ncbi:hypothetical protein KSP39_PZI010398 [Platanthera zijinensis]|uniref:Cytokinin riboside 5'-monophosphate phosphoribohydrolase n=1 Tax=Platanthera zijinensis TaxID=2320716 RepID=A0AAP0G6E0_9ASPA
MRGARGVSLQCGGGVRSKCVVRALRALVFVVIIFWNISITWAKVRPPSSMERVVSRQGPRSGVGRRPEMSERRPNTNSQRRVKKEIQSCYELIQKLGRGAVYLGSSRIKDDHPHYLQALELARDIARLLDCTTWTGAGPGLMDAAIKGALEAKKPVGGFKIAKESGEWIRSNFHPYLPAESYLTCRFFSARKHGFVDAATRNEPSDMTAVVAFPGGIGTLDEVFEILALIQLDRIGSELPVPFILMNYDSFYSKLLEFLHECEKWGTIADGEIAPLWKECSTNVEALEYLVNFYSIPQ